MEQMAMAGEEPDVIIGCAGGGSNFAGLDVPVPRPEAPRRGEAPDHRRRAGGRARRLTRGVYAYDFGDTGQMAPLVEDAHARPRLHPGADPRRRPALPRHVAARVSLLKEHGVIEARSVHQRATLRGRRPVRPGRGHPAGARADPRDHASRSTRRSRRKEAGEARVILFNLCGHGHFDLAAYERYLDGDARGLRVPGREGRGGARGAAEGLGELGADRRGPPRGGARRPATDHLPEWPVGRRKRRTSADDVGCRHTSASSNRRNLG